MVCQITMLSERLAGGQLTMNAGAATDRPRGFSRGDSKILTLNTGSGAGFSPLPSAGTSAVTQHTDRLSLSKEGSRGSSRGGGSSPLAVRYGDNSVLNL